MKISTDGLVIWQTRTGEADRVITILTAAGVITAYAKGSLLPKGKLTSPTAMLSWSGFELFSGKNMYTVDDAWSKNRFIKISADPVDYALAVYMCELIKQLAPVEDDASEFLSLILNSLYLLNEGNKDRSLIKAVFEFKIMCLAGYMPDIAACSACGDACLEGGFFNLTEGNLLCPRCARNGGCAVNCPAGVLSAERYIAQAEVPRSFSFTLKNNSDVFYEQSERYVLSKIDKRLQSLEFYKSVSG